MKKSNGFSPIVLILVPVVICLLALVAYQFIYIKRNIPIEIVGNKEMSSDTIINKEDSKNSKLYEDIIYEKTLNCKSPYSDSESSFSNNFTFRFKIPYSVSFAEGDSFCSLNIVSDFFKLEFSIPFDGAGFVYTVDDTTIPVASKIDVPNLNVQTFDKQIIHEINKLKFYDSKGDLTSIEYISYYSTGDDCKEIYSFSDDKEIISCGMPGIRMKDSHVGVTCIKGEEICDSILSTLSFEVERVISAN